MLLKKRDIIYKRGAVSDGCHLSYPPNKCEYDSFIIFYPRSSSKDIAK